MHLLFNRLYIVIWLPSESFISKPYFFKAGNVNLLSLVPYHHWSTQYFSHLTFSDDNRWCILACVMFPLSQRHIENNLLPHRFLLFHFEGLLATIASTEDAAPHCPGPAHPPEEGDQTQQRTGCPRFWLVNLATLHQSPSHSLRHPSGQTSTSLLWVLAHLLAPVAPTAGTISIWNG